MPHIRPSRIRLAIPMALTLGMVACGPSAKNTVKDVPARTYQVRGIVAALPEAPGKPIMIRHEAIHDFVDGFGETVGMNSMTMPFDLAPKLALGALREGDKVSVEWVMNWKQNASQITRLTRLPAETELHFGKANPTNAHAGHAHP